MTVTVVTATNTKIERKCDMEVKPECMEGVETQVECEIRLMGDGLENLRMRMTELEAKLHPLVMICNVVKENPPPSSEEVCERADKLRSLRIAVGEVDIRVQALIDGFQG